MKKDCDNKVVVYMRSLGTNFKPFYFFMKRFYTTHKQTNKNIKKKVHKQTWT